MNFNGSPTVFIAVRHYVASTVQPCTSSYTRTVPCHARAVGLGENTLAILSSPEAYENTLPLIPTVEGAKSSLLAALLQLQDSSLVACGARVPAIAQRTTQLQ